MMVSEMMPADRSLSDLEAVIERGLGTFVEVGQALLEIRDGRKYRDTHLTFQDYYRERWGFSRPRAYQLMQAAEVAGHLSTDVDIPPLQSEAQARELARLPDPESVREVWVEVKEEKGETVTAPDIRQAVDRRLGVVRPAPEPVPDFQDDYVEEVNQETEHGYAEPILDSQHVPHVSYPLPTPEPDDDTVADAVDDGYELPARGVRPARKAWHAAIAPSHYERIPPDDVIATAEPKELEQSLSSIERSICVLTRILEAGRRAASHPHLEVVR